MISRSEIVYLLRIVLRWWWVVIIAVALSTGTAYYFSSKEVRYYNARTSLMIGNTLATARPDQYQLQIGWSLARFYGELARREPILRPVQEKLQLPFPWWTISERLMADVVPNASLLELSITDTDPDRAAAIVNAIGEQLITYSPTSPDKIQAQQLAVEQQLKANQERIDVLKGKIAKLNEELQGAKSASDITDFNQQLVELNGSLAQEEQSYNQLLFYQNTTETNSLSFFERSRVPTSPLPSKRYVIIGMAGLAGLLMSLLAIYLLESLDRGWRGARDLQNRFSMDDLGRVPSGPPLLAAPAAFAEERFQAMRDAQTNILLAAAEQGMRTLMISSPQSSEARSAFSIDMADLFARSGHRVLIVDADFSNLFLTRMLAARGASRNWAVMSSGDQYNDIWAHLQATPLSNVALLPGRLEMNGAPAMIPSLRWGELVQHLLTTADVIIFDGPAALNGPDAALLAPHVDGIVLTLDPAHDNREDVNRSKARLLRQKGARLLGALTFTPSSHQSRSGSFWRQLRGQKVPELPPASTHEPLGSAEASSMPHEPLVTPPPTMSEEPFVVVMSAQSTQTDRAVGADDDVVTVDGQLEPVLEQRVGASEPQLTNGTDENHGLKRRSNVRRPRKAAQKTHRHSEEIDGDHV